MTRPSPRRRPGHGPARAQLVRGPARAGRAGRDRARLASGASVGRGDLAASLALVFPLLLLYQLAIVVSPSVVATDPVSRALFSLCHGRVGYLLVQAAGAAAFLWWLHVSGRARALALAVVGPVALEAGVVALLMWLGLPLLVHHALGLGLGSGVVSAIGAGVYEELAFRLLLVGGLVRVADALGVARRASAPLAVVAAALVFAAAHHLGEAGERWSAAAFAFRALAGAVLGATFWLRSLAHAAYAHVAYDLLVLFG